MGKRIAGLALLLPVLAIACTTYTSAPTDDQAKGKPKGVDGSAPPPGSVTPPPSGTTTVPPVQPPPPGSTFTKTCPACPDGATCITAGCNGGPNLTSCDAPFQVTGSIDLTAIVCPEGPKFNVNAICHGGGNIPAAVINLTPNANNWTLDGKGVHWIAATSCLSPGPSCDGGGDSGFGPGPTNDANGFLGDNTIIIGSQDTITDCIQVQVKIVKK